MRLKDKIAIVVGGGQTPGETIGNGRATAIRFAREGARVLVVDNRVESVQLGWNWLSGNTWDCLTNDDVVIGDLGGVASGNAALVSCD